MVTHIIYTHPHRRTITMWTIIYWISTYSPQSFIFILSTRGISSSETRTTLLVLMVPSGNINHATWTGFWETACYTVTREIHTWPVINIDSAWACRSWYIVPIVISMPTLKLCILCSHSTSWRRMSLRPIVSFSGIWSISFKKVIQWWFVVMFSFLWWFSLLTSFTATWIFPSLVSSFRECTSWSFHIVLHFKTCSRGCIFVAKWRNHVLDMMSTSWAFLISILEIWFLKDSHYHLHLHSAEIDHKSSNRVLHVQPVCFDLYIGVLYLDSAAVSF